MFSEIKESQKEEVLFLLKEVAQKQKQLLLYHFDWNKKELIRQTHKKKFLIKNPE